MKPLFIAIFCMTCLFIQPVLGTGIITLVFPPDNAALSDGRIEIIGLVPSDVDQVKISATNSSLKGEKTVAVTHGAFFLPVTLKSGKSRIKVMPATGGDAVKVDVAVPGKSGESPEEYRKFFYHEETLSLETCSDCHRTGDKKVNYKRLKPARTCQTGGCHEDLGQGKFVHGPVGAGTCIHCHNPHGSFDTPLMSRTGKELCTVCHTDSNDFFTKSHQHSPVEEGDCLSCHTPHESEAQFQLRAVSTGELCFNCHDRDSYLGGSTVHAPLEELECTLCHNAHAADGANLLSQQGNDLCFECHEDKKGDLDLAHQHDPVGDDCLSCHVVHSSDHSGLLTGSQETVCGECHSDATPEFMEALNAVTVIHEPVSKWECSACHAPHGSASAKLLKSSGESLCFNCHKDFKSQVRDSKFKHGPVMDSDCIACHDPHGSANPKILNTYFPDEFYVGYKETHYALCFECHNDDIAREATTTELTNFRNGSRNLHYLHVNKTTKGRSCKACHEMHAGPQEKHIRDEVPFGEMWSYPIEFRRTETGGGCTVGCHKPFDYDRVKPVKY